MGEIIRDRTIDYETIPSIRAELSAERDALIARQRDLSRRLAEETGAGGPAEHGAVVWRLRAVATSTEITQERYNARVQINATLRGWFEHIDCHPARHLLVLGQEQGRAVEITVKSGRQYENRPVDNSKDRSLVLVRYPPMAAE